MLQGKRVLLGVTGSIAAYKACDLVQRLKEQGCEVRVAMTPEATQLVHPNSLAALSGHAVLTEAWSGVAGGQMDHIAWARWADWFLIAPATAHTLAELAHGLTGNTISLLALVFSGPMAVAPAMNTQMLRHAAVQANLNTLRNRGVRILPSGEGVLACGEVGEGKLLEVNALVAHLRTCAAHPTSPLPHLAGKKALLTLGHTREPVDDVRFVSNRSSGLTGFALARALWLAGVDVHAIIGHVDYPVAGAYASVTQVGTSGEFQDAVKEKAARADIIIMAAAIADFVPREKKPGKIKASNNLIQLELKPSPHILHDLGRMKSPRQVLVGFALETEGLLSEAQRKLADRNCDWVVVNNPVNAVSGFGKNEVLSALVGKQGERSPLQIRSKEALAAELLMALEESLESLSIKDILA